MVRKLDGLKFGRLLVIKDSGRRTKNQMIIWLCHCQCGQTSYVRISNLTLGHTKSCGCLFAEDFVDGTKIARISGNKPITNKSGVTGVCWDKNSNKWKVYLELKGKRVLNTQTENFDDAVHIRKAAEKEFFQPVLKNLRKRGGLDDEK